MIRTLTNADIPACAEILCAVYNNELWQCRWTSKTARAYLEDYVRAEKFVGYIAEEQGRVAGALFAHEKIWWNNSELFIDEMFVLPEMQRNGLGSRLIGAASDHVKQRGLAGLTLSTNRYAPAPAFYRKNGFVDCEHILFMCKEL